ncbi:MAG: ABC transporter substrate-binding protein [Thermomicrobiales bacterium]|nr:ABC transporter substrate-binding protein [Thermomicrobiales bacterium]
MSQRTENEQLTRTFSRRQALRAMGGAGVVIPALALGGPEGARARGTSTDRLLSAAFQGEPVPGGSATVVTEADWVDLDPHTNALFASMQAWEYVYESLTQFDMDGNVAPALAESWENPDPLTYIFHLRPGVTWHDGKPFTAADVKYSFERVLNPETAAPQRSAIAAVSAIDVVDDSTLHITLSQPRLFFLETLANLLGTAIIPDGAAENGDIKTNPIGTGPFKVNEIRSGDYIRFERNPDYWEAPKPYLDELVLKLMVEEDTRVAWIRSGEADYIDLYAEAAGRLGGEDGITVLEHPKVYMLRITYKTTEGPLADSRVRKALDMALDRADMIDKARFGGATPTGFIPSGFEGFDRPESELPSWFTAPDQDAAKQLLSDAGFGDGFSISIKGSRPEHIAIALVAQQNWQDLGLEVNVEQMEYGTYIQDWNASNFEALVIGQTYTPDPLNYLWPIFHTDGSSNRPLYSNATVDDLLDQASASTDRAEVKSLLHQAEDFMWDDGTPQSYVYNALNYEGLRTRIQDYVPLFSARRTAFKQAWIAE